MSDNDLDQFKGVDFPPPAQPLSPLRSRPVVPGVNSALPPTPPGYTPSEGQEVGGLINFFKSLFHRQTDLDKIMDENGLRQPVVPPQPGGIRG